MADHPNNHAANKHLYMKSPLALLFLGLVKLYQLFISPLLGANCRFQPTCSGYAIEAISLHGGLKGGWLTLKRIAKCHPWGGFGYDPVPQSDNHKYSGEHTCASANDIDVNKTVIGAGRTDHSSGVKSDG